MARPTSTTTTTTTNSKKRTSKGGGEIQVSKSPAEFFADNQAIAGFDNGGKSLYTTIRELVENALDAAESIEELPDIELTMEEYTREEFNILQGLKANKSSMAPPVASSNDTTKLSSADAKSALSDKTRKSQNDSKDHGKDGNKATTDKPDEETTAKKPRRKTSQEAYFSIQVRDNGCGMSHDAIPNLLGRVLSGSKYGVRQTRGKFGLGAKMALIWSKKSTGLPIHITTSHRPNGGPPTSHVSECLLDIDIYRNCPHVLKHTKSTNTKGWVGSLIKIMIAGNWTTYKARILQYFQQLAIITPYAKLQLNYHNKSDPKRDLTVRYDRRSEQMPPPARQVKHHPASVNNLLIQQLAQHSKCKTLVKFLSTELAGVSLALSKRLLDDLDLDENMLPTKLTNAQVTQMVQLLRSFSFKAPDGSCLSPLGEYNLNLGIRQVWEPDLIATARDRVCAYEGHPFLVEAAVSLGGPHAKEGITVVRFANRIPLLFEGGADVATRVAMTKIRWGQYKVDPKRDKIGVFCSIVSTKIPYKGTGKEYIGDDLEEIQQSVKRALQGCCQQLRVHLTKRNNLLDLKQRKSKLVKYVPDVGRALFGLLEGMRKRQLETGGVDADVSVARRPHNVTATANPSKRLRLDQSVANEVIGKLDRKEITEDTIKQRLLEAIEIQSETPNDGEEATATLAKNHKSKKTATGEEEMLHPVFLVPLFKFDDPKHDVHHPFFTFRPIFPCGMVNETDRLSSDEDD